MWLCFPMLDFLSLLFKNVVSFVLKSRNTFVVLTSLILRIVHRMPGWINDILRLCSYKTSAKGFQSNFNGRLKRFPK